MSLLWACPPKDDPVRYEPLHRVRNIVDNMIALIGVHVPQHSWQERFASFRLPSGCGAYSERPRLKGKCLDRLRTIVEKDALGDVNETIAEWLLLVAFANFISRVGPTCGVPGHWRRRIGQN